MSDPVVPSVPAQDDEMLSLSLRASGPDALPPTEAPCAYCGEEIELRTPSLVQAWVHGATGAINCAQATGFAKPAEAAPPTTEGSNYTPLEAMVWDGSRASIEAITRWLNDPLPLNEDPLITYQFVGSDDVLDVSLFDANRNDFTEVLAGDWIVRGEDGACLVRQVYGAAPPTEAAMTVNRYLPPNRNANYNARPPWVGPEFPAGAAPPTEADEEYAIAGGWLVEVVNEHTCGTGPSGHFGAHEAGCGTIPMVPLERIFALLKAEADGGKFPCPDCGGDGWLDGYSDGDPDPYPCRCNPNALSHPDRPKAAPPKDSNEERP